MYCQHCGNELPDNSKFCNHCGQSVGLPVQTQSQATSTNGKETKTQSPQEVKTIFYVGSFFAAAFCLLSISNIYNIFRRFSDPVYRLLEAPSMLSLVFYCMLGGVVSITISTITLKFAKKNHKNYTLMIITLIVAILCTIIGLSFFCLTVLFSVS